MKISFGGNKQTNNKKTQWGFFFCLFIESWNIPRWKEPTKIIKSNSWLHTGPTKNQTIILRALSKNFLHSSGPPEEPFLTSIQLDPSLKATPCCSLWYCHSPVMREKGPALPLCSLCICHGASPQLLCSGLNKRRDLSCSSYILLSRSLPSLQPSFGCSLIILCPSILWHPKWHTVLELRPDQQRNERDNPFSHPAVSAVLSVPWGMVGPFGCQGILLTQIQLVRTLRFLYAEFLSILSSPRLFQGWPISGAKSGTWSC